MVDRERLADLEQREREEPVGQMEAISEIQNLKNQADTPVVFKTTDNALVDPRGNDTTCVDQPPFSHEQSEILAAVIATLRQELRREPDVTAALLVRVATLEGKGRGAADIARW
jgi:hypothetical protein